MNQGPIKPDSWDQSDIMEVLWQHYSDITPLTDAAVRAGEKAMEPVFAELSTDTSKRLLEPVCRLCDAYPRHAFR